MVKTTINQTGPRWYVSYYLNGKRIREYGDVNKINDISLKTLALLDLQKSIEERFNNSTVFSPVSITTPLGASLTRSVVRVLIDKRRYMKHNAFRTTKSHAFGFLRYAHSKGYSYLPISKINKIHITDFLNSKTFSNRTRNNYLMDLSAIFQHIITQYDGVITLNPCIGITKPHSRSETHVAYTEDEVNKIKNCLESNDPYLLFFCKFISYCFLRVDETRSLQIKHFDLKNMKLTLPAANSKTGEPRTKIIPEIFRKDILALGLDKYKPDDYIFTLTGRPGRVQIGKDYFTKSYKKVKKKLGFSRNHTMYGLRHTFVSLLIKNGASLFEVMQLTGHTTMSAFEKYIRSIRAMRPRDLSEYYSTSL